MKRNQILSLALLVTVCCVPAMNATWYNPISWVRSKQITANDFSKLTFNSKADLNKAYSSMKDVDQRIAHVFYQEAMQKLDDTEVANLPVEKRLTTAEVAERDELMKEFVKKDNPELKKLQGKGMVRRDGRIVADCLEKEKAQKAQQHWLKRHKSLVTLSGAGLVATGLAVGGYFADQKYNDGRLTAAYLAPVTTWFASQYSKGLVGMTNLANKLTKRIAKGQDVTHVESVVDAGSASNISDVAPQAVTETSVDVTPEPKTSVDFTSQIPYSFHE